MTPDMDIAAAGRTEATRHLVGQAQAGPVDLVTVSALELCVLGGPRHPLFDEIPARAWMQLGDRRRQKIIDEVTEGMVARGLLTGNSPRTGSQPQSSTYSLKPELGIMLAARCRPAFIIVTERAGQDTRTPRFFVLGDQAEPVRAIVLELPTALTPDIAGDFPNVRRLGPLGWFYRYILVSRDKAAEILAGLVIAPSGQSAGAVPSGWLVSAYHPERQGSFGYRLKIRGDGTKARLDGPGAGDGDQAAASYDLEGLRAVMLDLITGRSP